MKNKAAIGSQEPGSGPPRASTKRTGGSGMPRRQHRPGWLWSRPTSGSQGQIGGEVAAVAGPDTPVSPADSPPGSAWTPRASSYLVLSGLFATQLAGIFAARIPRHGFAIWLVLVTAGLLFGLQLCIGRRGAARWSRRRRLGGLLALGALTYLPLAALRVAWPGMAGVPPGPRLPLQPPRKRPGPLFFFV